MAATGALGGNDLAPPTPEEPECEAREKQQQGTMGRDQVLRELGF